VNWSLFMENAFFLTVEKGGKPLRSFADEERGVLDCQIEKRKEREISGKRGRRRKRFAKPLSSIGLKNRLKGKTQLANKKKKGTKKKRKRTRASPRHQGCLEARRGRGRSQESKGRTV